MKDRMALGRAEDVRDLTADIGADPYATERLGIRQFNKNIINICVF